VRESVGSVRLPFSPQLFPFLIHLSVMKVIILCGGKGTRLREETEFRPKPMVPIGRCPILWRIMRTYAR
jgi:hypothetical protein